MLTPIHNQTLFLFYLFLAFFATLLIIGPSVAIIKYSILKKKTADTDEECIKLKNFLIIYFSILLLVIALTALILSVFILSSVNQISELLTNISLALL